MNNQSNTTTTNQPSASGYSIGVIEGFYGKHWPQKGRLSLAPFFANIGINFYIYAPKSDAWLRKAWRDPFSKSRLQQLAQLSDTYQQHSMDFGVGLSPMEIWLDWGHKARHDLAQKIKTLETINPTMLSILLDDMRGDRSELAHIQCEIVDFIASITKIPKLSFCPTYYSSDPILDSIFGDRPADYLQILGENIPNAIDIFWTGPKVISQTIPDVHLEEIAGLIGRRPLLWDNVLANDGSRSSNFLYTTPPKSYTPATMDRLAGLVFNPMNQPWLSKHCIKNILDRYYDGVAIKAGTCTAILPVDLLVLFSKHLPSFQIDGLNNLTPSLITELRAEFSNFARYPEAREILAWLDSEYFFDPACLTD